MIFFVVYSVCFDGHSSVLCYLPMFILFLLKRQPKQALERGWARLCEHKCESTNLPTGLSMDMLFREWRGFDGMLPRVRQKHRRALSVRRGLRNGASKCRRSCSTSALKLMRKRWWYYRPQQSVGWKGKPRKSVNVCRSGCPQYMMPNRCGRFILLAIMDMNWRLERRGALL